MAEGSDGQTAQTYECPGCGYSTTVWGGDGSAKTCPDCGTDAIVPKADAREIEANRIRESPKFGELVFGDTGGMTPLSDRILGPDDAPWTVPPGTIDSDHITMVDGIPVIEQRGYGDDVVMPEAGAGKSHDLSDVNRLSIEDVQIQSGSLREAIEDARERAEQRRKRNFGDHD